MKIGIYAASCAPLESEGVSPRSLPTPERAVLNLALTLSEQHDVTLITSHPSPKSGRVRMLSARQLELLGPLDIFLVIKDWIPIFYHIEARSRSLWIPRGADEFSNMGLGDLRIAKAMDVLFVSEELDRDGLTHASGFPKEKIKVLGDPELETSLSWSDVGARFLSEHQRLIEEKTA